MCKNKSKMNRISVSYPYKYCISFAENYVFTTCGLCVNVKTNRLIKKVYNSGCIGYNINGKFFSLSRLRLNLSKIKTEKMPF